MADETFGAFTPDQCLRIWRSTMAFERTGSFSGMNLATLVDEPTYIKNESGEIIPAYAILQSFGEFSEANKSYIVAKRPINTTTATTDRFFINGPREIEVDGFGVAQNGPVFRVKKAISLSTVSGMRLGPQNGQWTINKGSMFTYLGDDDVEADVVRVDRNESIIFAVATSGVPGRSGTTLGTNTVSVKHITVSGANRVIADSGYTLTAYNLASTAVASGAYVLLSRVGPFPVVIWEECPP